MKKSMLLMVMVVLLMPVMAFAEFFVCEDTSKPAADRRLQYFFRDPSAPRPDYCRMIPDGNISSQLDLIPTTRLDYLKLFIIDPTFGIAQEKTQGEKDVVDAAIAARTAEAAARAAEKINDDLCAEMTLGGIDNKIISVRDGIRTALNAATNLGELRIATRDGFDQVLALIRRNYRCDRAFRN